MPDPGLAEGAIPPPRPAPGSALRARLAQLLPQGSFRRDTVVSMSAGVAARVITLASLPVIASFFDPSDLGMWTIVSSLTGYLLAVATLRYDIAVVIAPFHRMARSLLVGTTICVFSAALLMAVAVVVLPASFWQFVSGLPGDSQGLLKLMPLLLMLLGMQVMLQAYLTRKRSFSRLGWAQLLQAGVTPVASLALLLIAAPSGAVVTAGAMLGIAASLAMLVASCFSDLWAVLSTNWLTAAVVTARRYKVYPLYVLPYSLSRSTSERIVQVVFVGAYSVSALGAFAVARQLMMAPAVFLATSLQLTMFAHSAHDSSAEENRARVMRGLRLMIDAVGPALAFGVFWLMPAINLLMPARWADVGHFAWWCMLPAAMLFLVSWLDRMMDVIGRQRLGVFLQVASDVMLIVLALISPWLQLDAYGMVALLSVSQALYHAFWLVVLLRLLGVPWKQILALASYAAALVCLFILAQWAAKSALPSVYGLMAGAGLLLLAIARVAGQLVFSGTSRGDVATDPA